ncbi:MAG: hypothetical protein LBU85_13365 [Treponema sp.]|jgi:hypothetical protein|nr:hypothetical protein [Treponema sp.]
MRIKLTAFFAMLAVTVFSCSKLDVVGNDSVRAFDEILQNLPWYFAVNIDDLYGGWRIIAPDDSARFVWEKNFKEKSIYDVYLEFDAIPFHNAGFDLSKLSDDHENYFRYLDGTALVGTKLWTEPLQYDGEATPLATYKQIVKLKRGSIGYHGQMDHYGISLGNGNMFEWAKDLTTNDKDIVFVLNPEPFIAAGLDPNRVEGWVYAKVTVDDENGKPIQVDRLLKPFNLK